MMGHYCRKKVHFLEIATNNCYCEQKLILLLIQLQEHLNNGVEMNLRSELQILTKEARTKPKENLPNIYSISFEMNEKARSILSLLPQNARNAAREGNNSVEIMNVSREEYDFRYQTIKGVAAIVWNKCFDDGLNPSLEHSKNGYTMFANW
jgi:hypothetical protein